MASLSRRWKKEERAPTVSRSAVAKGLEAISLRSLASRMGESIVRRAVVLSLPPGLWLAWIRLTQRRLPS